MIHFTKASPSIIGINVPLASQANLSEQRNRPPTPFLRQLHFHQHIHVAGISSEEKVSRAERALRLSKRSSTTWSEFKKSLSGIQTSECKLANFLNRR